MRDEYNVNVFKRKHERKVYHAEVYFSIEAKAYPAKIRNLSMGGALIENHGFPKVLPGQTITINIPFEKTERNVKRRARVMWVSKTEFGIEFI